MLRRTPLRKVSKKHAKELAAYRVVRDKYMKEHPICEWAGCPSQSHDLHHKAKRGANLCNVGHFMALCRFHHSYCHSYPAVAREKGYLL